MTLVKGAKNQMTMLKKKLLTDRSGDLHEQIVAEAAKKMSEEIDAQILRGLYSEIGWHEVVLSWIMTHEQSQEVDAWVAKKTKGEYWNRGLVWMFENEMDAMWFKMRWMSV